MCYNFLNLLVVWVCGGLPAYYSVVVFKIFWLITYSVFIVGQEVLQKKQSEFIFFVTGEAFHFTLEGMVLINPFWKAVKCIHI